MDAAVPETRSGSVNQEKKSIHIPLAMTILTAMTTHTITRMIMITLMLTFIRMGMKISA